MGPVALPEREALWDISFQDKKALHGSAGIIAVGGKDGDDHGPTESGNKSRQPPRNNTIMSLPRTGRCPQPSTTTWWTGSRWVLQM